MFVRGSADIAARRTISIRTMLISFDVPLLRFQRANFHLSDFRVVNVIISLFFCPVFFLYMI